VRQAVGDPTLEHPDQVDAASVSAGVATSRWCANEARRIYSSWEETDDERDQRRLVDFIIGKGGATTVRNVQQGCRWLKKPGLAEAALMQLVKAGHGVWEPSPKGRPGQPTRRFRLNGVYGNPVCPIKNSPDTVDVDSLNATELDVPAVAAVEKKAALNVRNSDISQGGAIAAGAAAIVTNNSEISSENSAAIDALRAGGMPAWTP